MSASRNTSTDPHFASADPKLLQIWDDLQRWQTDFCLPLELPAYYTSRAWLNSRTVLDIGTGNGYYLGRIKDLFPDKEYTGIDSSAEFIRIAESEQGGVARFQHANLFDWSGQYDFLILRLLLQHLADIDRVFQCLTSLTTPGSSALVVDARDSVRFFYPSLPSFVTFFQAFREHEAAKKRNRDVLSDLDRAIQNHPEWVIGAIQHVLIPSSIPGNRELFRKTYRRVIDMLEQAGELKYDFDAVRSAWDTWCEGKQPYTQVGLTLLQLNRR